MNEKIWKRLFVAVLILQIIVLSLRLTEPFVDGRFHLNWGPPFWLLKAENMHQVNFFAAHLGAVADIADGPNGQKIATGWYSSHPQFLAIPLYIWTGLFGYGEWVVRSLTGVVTLVTTLLLWFAMRKRHTIKQATLFAFFWSILPTIIIFGRKLDQEPFVMLFLALALLGHERFITKKDSTPWLWTVAIFGLLWSDWSGFVFAALFFVAHTLASRIHAPSKKLAIGTVVGGSVGALVVGVQTALESKNAHTAAADFKSLYLYRSGSKQPGFWFMWVQRQLEFFWLNYGSVVGFVAVIFVARAVGVWRKIKTEVAAHGLEIKHLAVLIGVGTLAYALVVPQATAIHIYYQYFYSIAVAYGCVLLVERAELYTAYKRMSRAWVPIGVVIMVILCFYFGLTRLYQDESIGFGYSGEIELIKKVHTLDPSKNIIALIDNAGIASWMDNPNIVYYAGRKIPVNKIPDDGKFDFSYVIIMNDRVDSRIEILNKQIPKTEAYDTIGCARALCLLEKMKRK